MKKRKEKVLFLTIICFLISINTGDAEEIKYCNENISFEIKGQQVNITKCDEITVSNKTEFTIKFLECNKIEVKEYRFESNEGSKLPPFEEYLPSHQIFNDNELVYNRFSKLLTITYLPLVECKLNNGSILSVNLKIKTYPENYFPLPQVCTKYDWLCTEWKPDKCPESKKQVRNCELKNTTCFNPNAVKPSEVHICVHTPPQIPISPDQPQCIGKNWFSCNVINIGEFNFITFIKNLNISIKIILSFSILFSLYIAIRKFYKK